MRCTRAFWLLFVLVAGACLCALLPSKRAAADQPKEDKLVLRASLFPYVPNGDYIRGVVKKRWDALNTGVELDLEKYKDWDNYTETPPDDLDVFELDAINLDHLVRNNWIAPLDAAEADRAEDMLDFAWKGCLVDGRLYGLPRLACTNALFYRKGDDEVAKAQGIADLYKLLGDSPDAADAPEPNKGLLIDLKGGTNCACLYLDAVADNGGGYSLNPTLPSADSLDKPGLDSLTLLAKMAGRKQALHKDPTQAPDRPKWFAEGKGRCYVGYSERLYFMPKETHDGMRVRALPLGKGNAVNLYFVDLLSVNSLARGERRKAAVKLLNLCTSAETVKECLMPSGDGKSSSYLLPTRRSVLEDKDLLAAAPLYKDLAASINDKAVAFRLGPDGRRWLASDKKLIQARLFFTP